MTRQRVLWFILVMNVVASAQTFTVLHKFNINEGHSPQTGLARDSAGNLYGTTPVGGKYQQGNIYKVGPDGTTTVLHDFSGDEGEESYATPLLDTSGNLFGTSPIVQAYYTGTLWELRQDGEFAVLLTFSGSAGSAPYAGVISDSEGNLYGTTAFGPLAGNVFKYNLATQQEVTLHAFRTSPDGRDPSSPLHRDARGNLYGTTFGGGTYDAGTVFEVAADGATNILHSFTGGSDGKWLTSGVVKDNHGNLYGTVLYGGDGANGLIYKVEIATKTFTIVHSFNRTDGGEPMAGLVADGAGTLYGTTAGWGKYGYGTIFKFEVATNKLTTLYNFRGKADGGAPYAPLTLDAAGNLYGTTYGGGNSFCDCGVVFKLSQ